MTKKYLFAIYFYDCNMKKFILQYRHALSYYQAQTIIEIEALRINHDIIIQNIDLVETQYYYDEARL